MKGSGLFPTKKPAALAGHFHDYKLVRDYIIMFLSKSLSTGYKRFFEFCDLLHRKSLSEYSAGIAA